MAPGPPVAGLSLRRRLQREVDRLRLAEPTRGEPITEGDLESLPAPAQRYLRAMGVQGRARDTSFRARFVGRFRLRPEQKPWPARAWQYNVGTPVARVYVMRIDAAGVLPMFGTDMYSGGQGRMRGKLLGLVPVADGSGPEFDIGELTTFVNDALMLAPSMLLTDAVRWVPHDENSFEVTLSDAGLTSTSRVSVDTGGRMISVTSRDRWAALPGGLTRASWTTPIEGWAEHRGRLLPTGGSAVWHLPQGDFRYVTGRFPPESLEFDVSPRAAGG